MIEEEHPELFSSPGPAGTPVAGTACLGIPDGGIYMIYMIYIYIYIYEIDT